MEEWRNAHWDGGAICTVAVPGQSTNHFRVTHRKPPRLRSAGAAPRVRWRVPLCSREVGSGMTTLLAVYGSRAAATRAPPPRLPLRARFATSSAAVAAIARAAPRRGPQAATSDPPPPPRAAASPRTSSSKRRTCMCVDRGVRNASLAIYVLRHTSSPALMPATHPPAAPATPPATLSGATRPVRQILPFTLHHDALAARSAMPPPHRTNARPFRSTVSAGSCHHRTGLRVHHRTIRLQSIVIQFQVRRILSSDFVSPVQLPKWGLREKYYHSRNIPAFTNFSTAW